MVKKKYQILCLTKKPTSAYPRKLTFTDHSCSKTSASTFELHFISLHSDRIHFVGKHVCSLRRSAPNCATFLSIWTIQVWKPSEMLGDSRVQRDYLVFCAAIEMLCVQGSVEFGYSVSICIDVWCLLSSR